VEPNIERGPVSGGNQVQAQRVTRDYPDSATNAEGLLSVLVDLSFARELGQLTDVTRRAARRLTGAEGVTFVLRQGNQCLYADEDSVAPLWKGRRFPIEQCISGWVMLHREMAVVPDIYADPRVPTDAYRRTFVRSLLMVPVRKDDPVAAIGVYWATRHEATRAEQDLVQAIANGAALAMANVKLVSDLEEAAERERNARLVAERANRFIDQFLATVSHELRTPLNVIRGWLWQLRQPGITPELTRHALAVVERNAAIQGRLVEDLLDASRAISGAIGLEFSPVDLAGTCRQVADAERVHAEAKGLSLDVDIETGPLTVSGDTRRLEQVLRNLIDNAIKFTPAGGAILVSARRAAGMVRVAVRDTGIGLQEEGLRRLFDCFWQQDGSATRQAGGLGLGLTLVHELVRMHGGTVTVRSSGENAGTTIVVDVPLAGATAGAVAAVIQGDDGVHTLRRLSRLGGA
jgi:signal transduction histidine kinase